MRTVSEKYANIIWMIPIPFRQKRLRSRSVSDCSRLLNCLYRKQSENYSSKWGQGFNYHDKHNWREGSFLEWWTSKKDANLKKQLSQFNVIIHFFNVEFLGTPPPKKIIIIKIIKPTSQTVFAGFIHFIMKISERLSRCMHVCCLNMYTCKCNCMYD